MVALVGTYPPIHCGIATFDRDLKTALEEAGLPVRIALIAHPEELDRVRAPEVRWRISKEDRPAYRALAEALSREAETVLLNHEYGLFGGPEGAWVLEFAQALSAPLVTILHTVFPEPTPDQARILRTLARLSHRVVTMAESGREILARAYGIPTDRIAVIPHGIPDLPYPDRAALKRALGLEAGPLLLTFGLIRPEKGLETVIQALPRVLERHPNATYVIAGATHPYQRRAHEEAYRESLAALAERLGVAHAVRFYDRFLPEEELRQLIGAADLYLLPYPRLGQITSGVLSYGFALGKAILATPFLHAKETLTPERGVLLPPNDPPAWADAITELLDHPERIEALSRAAYAYGRRLTWRAVGQRYRELLARPMPLSA